VLHPSLGLLLTPAPPGIHLPAQQWASAQAPAPPGIKHLIRGLCAKQLKDMMEVRLDRA
jgi:hypothetical protein